MIHKKPYRVKTEHLLLLDDCRGYADCKECPAKEICESGLADDYIKQDLIDSRELIDKQEALIKEFHKIGREVINWNVSYIPLINILEKTKDYE